MTIEVRNQDGSLTRRKLRNRITACEKCKVNPIRTINYPYCLSCDANSIAFRATSALRECGLNEIAEQIETCINAGDYRFALYSLLESEGMLTNADDDGVFLRVQRAIAFLDTIVPSENAIDNA